MYPSLYRVVLSIISYRIFSSLFMCPCDLVRVLLLPPPSIVSIDPSLNCVIKDLFVSLKVPFRSCLCLCVVTILFVLFSVRPFRSIRLFIVSYRILCSLSFSCRTGSFSLSLRVLFVLVRVLLLPPMTTPTDDTPIPSLVVVSILNWIRTHLSRRANDVLHVSVTTFINQSVFE